MVVTLKILVISLLIIAYLATSLFGFSFMAGCIIGDLIGDRLYASK